MEHFFSELPVFNSWGQVALVALGAFLAVRYLLPYLKKDGRNNGAAYTYKDASGLADGIKDEITSLDEKVMREVRDKVMKNVDDTRHILANGIIGLRDAINEQTLALSGKLDELKTTVRDSLGRRSR